jgi:hypothetical protein
LDTVAILELSVAYILQIPFDEDFIKSNVLLKLQDAAKELAELLHTPEAGEEILRQHVKQNGIKLQ